MELSAELYEARPQLLTQLADVRPHRLAGLGQPGVEPGEVELVEITQVGALRIHLLHPVHEVFGCLHAQRLVELAGQRVVIAMNGTPFRVPFNLKVLRDRPTSNSGGEVYTHTMKK